MKIGVIGYGKMGGAICDGINKNGVSFSDIYSVARTEKTSLKLVSKGINVVNSVSELYGISDLVLFSVKPQDYIDVLKQLGGYKGEDKMILTVAAGISMATVNAFLGDKIEICRIMPSTSASIGLSATSVAFGKNVSQKSKKIFLSIVESIGSYVEMDEKMIDIGIAASGSYIAYAYYFMRGFVEAAKSYGMDEKTAEKLVFASTVGAAKMAENSEKSLDELISDVCSKGGTTIEGVKVFDEENLNGIIKKAYTSCTARAAELTKINEEKANENK